MSYMAKNDTKCPCYLVQRFNHSLFWQYIPMSWFNPYFSPWNPTVGWFTLSLNHAWQKKIPQ
jgi:hypothetical protein